jgi:hypothetical protein
VEIFKFPNHVKWIYRVVGRFSHSIDSVSRRVAEELGAPANVSDSARCKAHQLTLAVPGNLSVNA